MGRKHLVIAFLVALIIALPVGMVAKYIVQTYVLACVREEEVEEVEMARQAVLPEVQGLPVVEFGGVSECDSGGDGYASVLIDPSAGLERVVDRFEKSPWESVRDQRPDHQFYRAYRDGDLAVSIIDGRVLHPAENFIQIKVYFELRSD
ncbi:hypothetical protein [Thermomonospora cellulosilytica]|uniref:Uncharacterized protein n=1 Tax=Thermomonospora cellulosilytica TaxID=1411118 RepID=A0A7W3MWI5_9ACTN|nr:hypothetical protein [Thermomonospora cellulosilytica]MBA9003205.1 hypothetical protein [Thermomonospora cellulosilytica]